MEIDLPLSPPMLLFGNDAVNLVLMIPPMPLPRIHLVPHPCPTS